MRADKSWIAFLATFIASVSALAAPGQIDTTFGIGGARRLDFGAPESLRIDAAARQPDGKLVVAGYYENRKPGRPKTPR
jgi:hypothetical protein